MFRVGNFQTRIFRTKSLIDTFREETAVLNETGDSVSAKKDLASITAHEVAHQWFGNLVTPKWWDDVWLKEGFSTFFGDLALNVVSQFSLELLPPIRENGAYITQKLHCRIEIILISLSLFLPRISLQFHADQLALHT